MNIWKEKPDDRRKQETELNCCDITELNLSPRPYNCLRRAGCNTIADLLRLMEDEEGTGLRKLRNLGTKSEAQILQALQEFREQCGGLANRQTMQPVDAGKGIGRTFSKDDPPVIRRRDVSRDRSIWDSSIEEYHLSNYALNGLKQHGINYVKDLYATNPKDEPGWYAVRELFEKIVLTLGEKAQSFREQKRMSSLPDQHLPGMR